MSDSGPLIVPVEVQAMVVNNPNMNFIRAPMNYGQLQNFMSPSPAPFQQEDPDFAGATMVQGAGTIFKYHGVYLMWTLPRALRHGQQNASGSIDFPFVPNRWLVVRLYRPALAAGTVPPAQAPAVAAWVVQSDFLDPANGTSAFLDPTTGQPTQIGQMVAITPAAPWQEPTATPAFFLKAVTESNPAFAAYQPFNQNVFSVFDNLVAQNIGPGTISYFVFGWYSQSAADILAGWQAGVNGKDFSDLLDELKWTASGLKSTPSAPNTKSTTTSVYHGSAFGVSWQPGASPPPSPKDNVVPQVAVGNTSIDGVTAFARAAFENAGAPQGLTPAQAADILEAFQYNVLPMLGLPGGEAMLEQTIRSVWFGSTQAGTTWTIVDAPAPPGTVPPAPPTAVELTNEANWLAALNAAQAQFDAATRELIGVQRDLFELWWKEGTATNWDDPGSPNGFPWTINSLDQFQQAMTPLIARARQLLTATATLSSQIPVATAGVSLSESIVNFAQTRNLPPNRMLKAVSQPRFWSPGDPVAVISNTAHLLKIDPDAKLACRWPAELVSQLNAGGGSPFTITSSQLTQFLPEVAWTNLPNLSQPLFQEFFLLDPANAALVAAGASQNVTADQVNAIAASMSPPSVASGQAPALLASYPWAQPWQPVYFDWDVQWFPIPFPNWEFNGLDYDLLPGLPAATQPATLLTGRSVLTPKPSFELKARIDQFLHDYPQSDAAAELKNIEDLVATVDGWDFLSQTFSGLQPQIASWNPVSTQNPDNTTQLPGGGTLAQLIGDQARMPPNPTSGTWPVDPTQPIPPSTFEGMRGGQFFVNQLTIVDAFGQTLEIVFAPLRHDQFPRTKTNDVFHPLLSDGVAPTEPIETNEPLRFVQLPPRLLQQARLNFDFLPAATGNPIVGWILPNHLDSGLSVYGLDGTSYGELTLGTDQNDEAVVDWIAAPNSPFPVVPDPAQAQGDLLKFVSNLKSLGAGAFSDFLQAVDETLWTIDPLGNRSDSFLSVLIGRPLAVVTASLSFELEAAPWRDTDWPYTFEPRPDPLFLSYKFPVRLGDLGYREDGLIGYFLDEDYSSFHSIHVPDRGPSDPPLSGYLKKIEVGNYINNLGFAKQGPGTPATLTMIMDPRGSVHSQCGFLPVKEVTLVPDWVDSALAKIAVTFRTGPMLLGTEQVVPKGQTEPITALLLTSPAEQHGTWSWVESDGQGNWPETALTPVDGTARFPDTPPTLRDGSLKLTGGLDE